MMRKIDQAALLFVSEVLEQIRLLAKQPPSQERMLTIAALADAMHNIPRVIAEGSSEQLAYLVQGGIEQGVEAWKKGIPDRSPLYVPS